MKMDYIDKLIISLLLISLIGTIIVFVLLSFQAQELYEQKIIIANNKFEIGLKDIKINQLEKELDNCNYINKQLLVDEYLSECVNVNMYYGADKNTFNNTSEVFEKEGIE